MKLIPETENVSRLGRSVGGNCRMELVRRRWRRVVLPALSRPRRRIVPFLSFRPREVNIELIRFLIHWIIDDMAGFFDGCYLQGDNLLFAQRRSRSRSRTTVGT